jgi:hypothetical protein
MSESENSTLVLSGGGPHDGLEVASLSVGPYLWYRVGQLTPAPEWHPVHGHQYHGYHRTGRHLGPHEVYEYLGVRKW